MSNNSKKKIRLFVKQHLSNGNKIILSENSSHYLCNVMRLQTGEIISCFNNQDGEFDCIIDIVHKKQTQITVTKQTKIKQSQADIWLLFAPVKKEQTDFIIEKSTELGISNIIPVITDRTINTNVRVDRFEAQAVEASEQCGRINVPQISQAIKLADIIKNWDNNRVLFFMDEKGLGTPCVASFSAFKNNPAAVLIGPEGGFSDKEASELRNKTFVKPVSLGPRILRAETAVVSAISVWQAIAGDWNEKIGD